MKAIQVGSVYFNSDPDKGFSLAVKVLDKQLIHTTQVLPLDATGKLVSKGNAAKQIEQVFEQLDATLQLAGSGVKELVKLNVYAISPEVASEVQKFLAKRHNEHSLPAVSFVTGQLSHPDALVAMDAVALGKSDGATQTRRWKSGDNPVARAALLPTGRAVYVAGQAEKGMLPEATRKTLESLTATLNHLKLDKSSIVQLKAFVTPISDAAVVEKEVVAFFGGETAPPLVLVEWKSTLPIEIELIAAAGPANPNTTNAVTYFTPPGMTASPIYSRVAIVEKGHRLYISGLYGEAGQDATAQTKELFTKLGNVLKLTGSDFNHLVKATYYVSDNAVSAKLNELRPNYYDPKRPPAASKAMVPGVGMAGRTITMDMIAVAP